MTITSEEVTYRCATLTSVTVLVSNRKVIFTLETEFKIGDLVSYNYSDAWRGGKGRVTDIQDNGERILVKAIEVPNGAQNAYPNGDHSGWTPDTLKLLPSEEAVEHPAHYGGGDNPYEVIKVAEAWGLDKDAYLFNVLKYIARAGKKDPSKELEDLRKARFYNDRRIKTLEEAQSTK